MGQGEHRLPPDAGVLVGARLDDLREHVLRIGADPTQGGQSVITGIRTGGVQQLGQCRHGRLADLAQRHRRVQADILGVVLQSGDQRPNSGVRPRAEFGQALKRAQFDVRVLIAKVGEHRL